LETKYLGKYKRPKTKYVSTGGYYTDRHSMIYTSYQILLG